MIHDIKVLDLFSGAGGLSLGFQSAGFNIVGAIDNMKDSCTTFIKNKPNAYVINNDVRKVDPKVFLEKIGRINMILGGPPCQGLSLAGKRVINDPRNKLFLEFVKYVNFLKPDIFVMENVPGLLSMDNGKTLQAILNSFKEIGYNSFYDHKPQILLAANYGVPQLRKRLFFIGTKNKIPFTFPPPITHTDIDPGKPQLWDIKLKPFITVDEAICDLPGLKSGEGKDVMDYDKEPINDYQREMRKDSRNVYNHVSPNHTEKLIQMISIAEPGSQVDPKYSDSKKWDANKPSFTIKALGAGGGSTNRRAFHYRDSRGSTVRENARIQSFPDNYRFYGSKTSQMTQVGNAVPPILAKHIALSLMEYFKKLG